MCEISCFVWSLNVESTHSRGGGTPLRMTLSSDIETLYRGSVRGCLQRLLAAVDGGERIIPFLCAATRQHGTRHSQAAIVFADMVHPDTPHTGTAFATALAFMEQSSRFQHAVMCVSEDFKFNLDPVFDTLRLRFLDTAARSLHLKPMRRFVRETLYAASARAARADEIIAQEERGAAFVKATRLALCRLPSYLLIDLFGPPLEQAAFVGSLLIVRAFVTPLDGGVEAPRGPFLMEILRDAYPRKYPPAQIACLRTLRAAGFPGVPADDITRPVVVTRYLTAEVGDFAARQETLIQLRACRRRLGTRDAPMFLLWLTTAAPHALAVRIYAVI